MNVKGGLKLPSPYLSGIKIERELVKKAQAIKEKREKCEKYLEDIERSLNILKNYGITEEYQARLNNARSAFDIKDFDKALSILEPLYNDIKSQALEIFKSESKKIEEIISKGELEDSAKLKAYMEEAKSKLASDFVSSFKILEDIDKKISTNLKDMVEKRKRELLSKVVGIPDFEWVKEDINKIKGTSQEALVQLEEIERKIENSAKNIVDKNIKSAEKLISLAKSAHYSLSVDMDKKDDALRALDSGDYSAAINLSQEFLDSTKDSFKLFFGKLMEISKFLIKEGEEMGENMNGAFSILEQAKKAYSKDDLDNAIALVKKATEEAEKIKLHKVLELMKNARDKLLEAKKKGIEISPYLGMIDNAKNFLKIGKHKKAYDTIQNALQMLERKLNLYSQLKVEIEELQRANDELRKENIILEGVEDKIEDIKESIEKNPEEAEKMVDKLKKIMIISLRDIANTLFQDISTIINKGTSSGIDLRDLTTELESVEKLMKDENYKESIITLRKIEEKLYERVYKEINAKLKEFEEYENKDINSKVDSIRKLIEEGEILKVIDEFAELQNLVFDIEKEKYTENFESIEKRIEFLKNLGENTDRIEELLHKAKNSLENRDIKNTAKNIEECTKLIDTISQNLAEKAYEKAKDIAEESSKLKIDLDKNGIMEMLNAAAESLKDEKYQDVIKYSAEIEAKVKEIKTVLNKVLSMRENLEKRKDELKEKGYNITSLEKLIKDIEKSIQNNDFKNAENLAKTGFDMANKIEFEGKINKLKREIESLGKIMKDFNFKDDYLTITEDFFINYKEKRYENLEEIGRRAIENLKKSIEIIFNNYLNRIERMVSDLKDTGVKVDDSPLAEAKEKFWGGNITDAFSVLKNFESNIKKIHGEKMELMNLENRLGRLMTVASSLGIETKGYLERAKKIEEYQEIEKRKEEMRKLSEDIEKSIKDKIEKIIKDVEVELNRMRRMGENVTTAESMLVRANNSIKKKDYKNALSLTLSAMEEINNISMQKNTAFGILKTLDGKIGKMRGLIPKDILNDYREAKTMFLNDRYREAINKAMNVSEKLWHIERVIEIIKDKNREIKRFIEQGKSLGLDMKNILIPLAKAKKELQNLNYENALKLVNEAYNIARRNLDEMKNSYRQRFEEILKPIIEFQLREELEDDIKNINDAFAKNDVAALDSLLPALMDKAKKMVNDIMKERMKEFEELSKIVRSLKLKDKINIDDERNKLKGMYENPKQFLEYYEELKERMIGIVRDSLKLKIGELIDRFKRFEDMGLNISDYIDRASNLKEEIDEMDYQVAINEVNELERNFETYLKEYTKDKASRAKDMVMKYSESKAKEFERKILEAIEKKDYKRALKLYEDALRYVSDYRNKVAEFNKKAMELKELIKSAISRGLNMEPYIKELKETLSSEKNLEKGIATMEKIKKDINGKIDELTPKLAVKIESTTKAEDKYLAKIKVINQGSTDALNVILKLDGALKSENDINIMKVAKGSEEIVESFLVEGEGDKINVNIAYERFDGRKYKDEFSIEYKVSKRGFHIEKNTKKVKCTLCRGTILPGMDIVVCDNCGAVYHVPCAKRAGKCLKCGTPFNFE